MDSQIIHVGDQVVVKPLAPIDQEHWNAVCTSLPDDWACELIHRSSTDVLPNLPLTGWVLQVDYGKLEVEVSDSNFGFLPISDRMRPRYVVALQHVAGVIRGEIAMSSAVPEHFSEVKGMFSRCFRRDQWDWFAVSSALGDPPSEVARKHAHILGEIASILRLHNYLEVDVELNSLRQENLIFVLQQAEQEIANSIAHILNSNIIARKNTKHEGEVGYQSVQILSSYPKRKLDYANVTHAKLLEALRTLLTANGYIVEANQFVDAFTRLKSGPAIFEIKSITDDNELSQVRQAISQLYEYRFRHDIPTASLWFMLSRKPQESWIVQYLEIDRDIRLLWTEDGLIVGPSAARLFESGSDALRRGRDV